MSEYIGSVISLISKSDIRYLGTLHEINSENSTVALENVKSFGTEGRRGSPDEEIPPSDSVYEYIVFRGSDVKDLRIEEAPTAKENKPPQVPNDPAILGSGQRPTQPPAAPQERPQQPPHQQQSPAPGQPPFPQHSPYPGGFYPPPPPGGWGRGGPGGPGGPGFPAMPYGAPPGWFPPPGQGFPPGGPGPYGYGQYPPAPFGGPQPPQQGGKPAPIGPGAQKQQESAPGQGPDKNVEPKSLSQQPPAPSGPAAGRQAEKALPKESGNKSSQAQADPALSAAPTGPKSGRIMPVIPLQSPNVAKAPLQANTGNVSKPAPSGQPAQSSVEDATRAASAAVAAAMAKLSVGGQQPPNGSTAMDNLTKKVNEMRSNDASRGSRHANNGNAASHRGRGRGGPRQEGRKVDVPAADFDFESSNAKFNKQDLVKEAIAGSPLTEAPPADPIEAAEEEKIPTPVSYNKNTSFFDNISSEAKERADSDGKRPGGKEWRGEEQKKNIETFGQESVDNGYRGGYRGRGRGRGGYRGRGYSNQRGRGNYRGRGNSQTAVPSQQLA